MKGSGVTHSVDSVFHRRGSIKFGTRGSTAYAGHSYGAGDGVFDKLWTLHHGNVVKYLSGDSTSVGHVRAVKQIGPHASIESCYDLRGKPRACLITCDERTRTADGVYHGKIMVLVDRIRKLS